jgi:CRP/FNR family transcriptional regulator
MANRTQDAAGSPLCPACPLRSARRLAPSEPAGRWFLRGEGVERRSAELGTELIREGENLGSVGALFTGWGLRYKLLHDGRRQILDILLPGDTFGLDAILFEKPEHLVLAASPVSYGVMANELVKELLATTPAFAAAMLQRLAQERRALDRHLVLLGRCDAEERVATFILELHARLRRLRIARNGTFTMPLTQQQVGDHLGLTIVHVNRVLRRFRERGIATARDRTIVIHDLPGLHRLARMKEEFVVPVIAGNERRPHLN